jgi:glycine cleavage system H protein
MAEVAIVRNCVLPLDLYYKVEDHIWVRVEADGNVTLGFTDMAQTTAGGMLHVTFRPVGKFYPRGKVVALVESAKWLGPLRTPVAGTLTAVNEALPQDAGLINRSPYRRGWLARLEPEDLEADLAELVTGEAAVAAYEAFMAEKGLDDCVHCEGYEMP